MFRSAGRSALSLLGRSLVGQAPAGAIAPVAAACLRAYSTVDPSQVLKGQPSQLFIGGKFVDAVSGKTFGVIDPRSGEEVFRVAEGDAADVDRAVAAARKAFDEGEWPRMSGVKRGKIMMRLAELIEAHADELAAVETLDNGKPIFFSKVADIPLTADHFRYYSGWADKIQGKTIPVDSNFGKGSTEVGKIVMDAAAKRIVPVSLELGGKSPLIVDKSVDVDKAVEDTHFALYFNHGQCCAAGSRTYVHEAIYDEFVEKAAARASKRKVGDPFGDVEQGPQVDEDQMTKILSYIDIGQREGARLVVGGKRIGDKGYFVEPTVFADVTDDMRISREEIFGPVMSILKYSSTEEVIQRANDCEYGLAAGIISKDLNFINTVSRSLKSGTVWVNCYNVYESAMPFGGYKASGIGRDKGEYALENYTQVKAVYQSLDPNQPWL